MRTRLATLGGIPAKVIHKAPGKTLVGGDYNATTIPLPGPGKGIVGGLVDLLGKDLAEGRRLLVLI